MTGPKKLEQASLSTNKIDLIEQAFDRSAHELQLLANFYHQHGYSEQAQEIYRAAEEFGRNRGKKRVS